MSAAVSPSELNGLDSGPLKCVDSKVLTEADLDRVVNGMVTGDIGSKPVQTSAEVVVGEGKENDIKLEDTVTRKFRVWKLHTIGQALENGSTSRLRTAALDRRGLICDDVRRLVWPKIGGVSVYETSPRPAVEDIENHPYYSQVVLDVKRSLKRFPPSIAEAQRIALQDKLVFMIMRVLMKNPELHYYQGYHDICVTILLVLGEEIGFLLVEKLSRTNLSVFMEKTMAHTAEVLEHIYPLIGHGSPKLRSFLEKAGIGIMFCLSWVITWFGHVLNDYDMVVRLFDLFLASHSWMPLYLSAAVVLHKENEILQLDCDMAQVHSYLSRVVEEELPFENLITNAREMMSRYPPSKVKAERAKQVEEVRRRQPVAKETDRLWRCFHYVGTLYRGRWGTVFVAATAVAVIAMLFQLYRRHSVGLAAVG